jgi:rhodanese-related sulfurtransferase
MSNIKRCYALSRMLLPFFVTVFFVFTAWNVQAQLKKQEESSSPKQTTIIKKFTPKEALEVIQKNSKNPDFVILDVRTPEEFDSGHIEGATNINYHNDTFVEDLNKLDKNKTYLVYCRTGRRSADTVGIMIRQGFKELYRFDGDIVKWKSEGLPVVKGAK